jgi:hypothetical protein
MSLTCVPVSRRLVLTTALCAAAAGAVSLPSVAAADASIRLELPRPTGPYAVGMTELHLVDASRADPWLADGRPRELMVSVWYPAQRGAGPVVPRRGTTPTPITSRSYQHWPGTSSYHRGCVRLSSARSIRRAAWRHSGPTSRRSSTSISTGDHSRCCAARHRSIPRSCSFGDLRRGGAGTTQATHPPRAWRFAASRSRTVQRRDRRPAAPGAGDHEDPRQRLELRIR